MGKEEHDTKLVEAISGLTIAIENSTQERDNCCNAIVYEMLVQRLESIAKRLHHAARLARELDSNVTPT